ncbi:hypothetical protein V6N12_048002 [Hibiscus sabdariffa]|uniref:Uncharacterized protein n=1 Tax=Hibiscus sabdariffa TaxID=183260 RepID=A0ABR2CX54_9ROSI
MREKDLLALRHRCSFFGYVFRKERDVKALTHDKVDLPAMLARVGDWLEFGWRAEEAECSREFRMKGAGISFFMGVDALMTHPPKACILIFVHVYSSCTNLSAPPRIRTTRKAINNAGIRSLRDLSATEDNGAWIFEVDEGIVRALQCYMLFYVQKQLYHKAIEDLSFVRISLHCTEIHSHLQLVVPLMQNGHARKADQR